MVGKRIYGMDKYGKGQTAVLGALSTAHTCRSWILRPPGARNTSGTGGTGKTLRHRGILLLPLLVRTRAAATGATLQRGIGERRTGLSVLHLLGERLVDGDLAWSR